MPILKSAKKRVKQAEKRRVRNFTWRSQVKTYMHKVLDAAKKGDQAAAEKHLQKAYSVIDTALKKNILHRNNAARKKSRLAKAIRGIGTKEAPKKAEAPKKEPAKEVETDEKK